MKIPSTGSEKYSGRTGRSRIEEITAAAGKVAAAPAGGMNRGMRRAGVRKMLQEHGLVLHDPARDGMIASIAADTEGFVGADLEVLCREAGIFAMRESVLSVGARHFSASRKKVHPTMNKVLRESYQRVQQHFKGGLPKEVQPPEYQ